jgi:NDP-sugar pyrophosphorylase family protein
MKDITLMVMAAGMGSRYGGLKQLDGVGPNDETIIDYSVYDAIKAGFNKVVFIIRKEFENEFKSQITDKYENQIEVQFAFQDIENLPPGFLCPKNRKKPWGTGHAILSAAENILEPFVAINGDDFYGRESFKLISDFYQSGADGFAMVSFQLKNTLSKFGGVSRGICGLENGKLKTISETHGILEGKTGIISEKSIKLKRKASVSMNYWGFTPRLFPYLEAGFIDFLNSEGHELNSEYLIPSVVNNLIKENKENVHVLSTNSTWFGVTYKEDKPLVIMKIQNLIKSGIYPEKLF